MRPLIFILALSIASCVSGADEQNSSVPLTVAEHLETIKEAVSDEAKVPSKGYRTVSLYGNKLELSIPDYFTEMSPEMKHSKYPRANSPDVVYTDEDGAVNVAFNYTGTVVANNNISELQRELLKQLQATNPIDLTTRIETINGSEFAVFEFMSQAIDTRVYNLMFLTELDGRMLLGTFNCTEVLKGEWQPRAKEILSSLRKG
ncbi:hypothetical protein FAZ19_15850 [Sphingobacterium alkalisoli]|uniref:DUF4252 domain-containing protein n=1 Tax=Sphingobacterium alkalisoli TaxID=1874115 RepID=A0A4U0H0L8_9SPHI|nr:hypothetical protein [Sphingobacterium alkalisoli]TJY63742.1 hypothetical protein FAZ19_15850 [Sphingobacterium alkalisoli]GGH25174.1 hypothetical protein GCM10011418_33610 [Sphingobacterium alkalisoli]